MADKIIIAQLDIDVNSLVAGADEAREAIKKLKNKIDDLANSGEESSQQFKDMKKELNKLTEALEEQSKIIKQTAKQNNSLSNSITDISDGAKDARSSIDSLNGSVGTMNTKIAEGDAKISSGKKTFNDYKDQVKGAFNSISIFNDGMGGLISRAQEAGGAGPLVKNAFNGIAEGIGGMTKSSLAFMATPFGAALAIINLAISSMVSYFTETKEGIDKVTSVTRPLQAIFSALSGIFQSVGKFLFEAFTNPKQSLENLYKFVKQNLINRFTAFGTILEGIINLDFKKIGNGIIQAATGVENAIDKTQDIAKNTGEFFADAIKKGAKYDELQKKLDKTQSEYLDKTTSLGITLENNNRIAADANKPFTVREAAAKKALETLKQQNKVVEQRLDLEIQALNAKKESQGLDDNELKQLDELLAKRKQTIADAKNSEQDLANTITGIRNERETQAAQQRQQALKDAIDKKNLELNLFMEQQKNKKRSMDEELAYAKTIAEKKKAIAIAEYNASNKTENDKLALKLANAKIDNDVTQASALAAVAAADKELQAYIEANQSKLNDNGFISDAMYQEEVNRLDAILKKEKEFQEARKLQGLISEEEYKAAIKSLDEQSEQDKADLNSKKKEAEDAKAAIDLENKRATETANMDYDLDSKLKQLDLQRQQELDAAEKTGADKNLINAKYDKEEKEARKEVLDNKLELANATFGNLATIMGKESKAGKAIAVAQATIDTYQAANKALAAYPPPFNYAAVGAVVATGIGNVKKITSTKAPKAEKGALFSIGGKRHSAGGTLFTGEDGTRFEAEKGELIGVMNRNAARHFMAFNNTFPSGGGSSAGNYFESGGIVSREIAPAQINMQELANLTAQAVKSIPAPVVAVEDIINQGNSYVRVRESANF